MRDRGGCPTVLGETGCDGQDSGGRLLSRWG